MIEDTLIFACKELVKTFVNEDFYKKLVYKLRKFTKSIITRLLCDDFL